MNWLLKTFIKTLCWCVARIPLPVRIFVGRGLGLFWFYVVPIRRKVALENIKRAFPDWSQKKVWVTARRNFQNYGCGVIELLLLPALTKEMAEGYISFESLEKFRKAQAQGQGVFFLTLHLGSWELMSATSYILDIVLNVITKKMKAKSINEIWVNLRVNKGIRLISEEKSTFEILRAIRRNEVVGFILDQFLGPPVGRRVHFFGHETGAPAALALFASRTQAPVVPVYNVRELDGKIRVIFEDPVPFVEQGSNEKNISFMTQVYTSKIEEIVRKYPEQWLWIHRRWKPFRE